MKIIDIAKEKMALIMEASRLKHYVEQRPAEIEAEYDQAYKLLDSKRLELDAKYERIFALEKEICALKVVELCRTGR